MHEVLVNPIGGLSLPRKSVVRLTDRPDMTLDVYRGRKTTMQQCNNISGHYFLGSLDPLNSYYQYQVHTLSTVTDNCLSGIGGRRNESKWPNRVSNPRPVAGVSRSKDCAMWPGPIFRIFMIKKKLYHA